MNEMTRRDALKFAAATSALGAASSAFAQTQTSPALSERKKDDQHKDDDQRKDEEKKHGMTPEQEQADRKRIIEAGMTEDEADCWELTAKLAGKLLGLPQLHVMDEHELTHALHVIQYRILARPTYRKYLEIAKSGK